MMRGPKGASKTFLQALCPYLLKSQNSLLSVCLALCCELPLLGRDVEKLQTTVLKPEEVCAKTREGRTEIIGLAFRQASQYKETLKKTRGDLAKNTACLGCPDYKTFFS